MKDEVVKGYAYLRWLVLIAAGAFSVSFSLLTFNNLTIETKWAIRMALTFNAIGVFTGVIAVSGEARLATGIKRVVIDKIIDKLKGIPSDFSTSNYQLPFFYTLIKLVCFISLSVSLGFWIHLIWLL